MAGIYGYFCYGEPEPGIATAFFEAVKKGAPAVEGQKQTFKSADGSAAMYWESSSDESTPVVEGNANAPIIFTDGWFCTSDEPSSQAFVQTNERSRKIAASLEKGADCGIRGNYATGCWNPAERTMMISADRFNTKTLYYTVVPEKNLFVFGSRLNVLTNFSGVRKKVSQAGLAAYLIYGFLPAPLTPYENVCKVFPGEVLRIDARGEIVKSRPRTVVLKPDHEASYEEHCKSTRESLLSAVEFYTTQYGEVGNLLSGGIDSTLMLAAQSKFSDKPIKAFTLDYDDVQKNRYEVSDLRYAQYATKLYGAEHFPLIRERESVGLGELERIAPYYDEPITTLTHGVTTDALLELARAKGVKHCITGNATGPLYGLVAWKATQRKMRKGKINSDEDILDGYGKTANCDLTWVSELLPGLEEAPIEITNRIFTPYREMYEAESIYERFMNIRLIMQAGQRVLGMKEAVARQRGVSCWHPFVHPDVHASAIRIPGRYKGEFDLAKSKAVLVDAFRDMIPEKVVTRPKVGLPSSVLDKRETLVRYSGEKLTRERLSETGILNPKFVADLFEKAQTKEGLKRSAKLLRNLTMLQVWAEANLLS